MFQNAGKLWIADTSALTTRNIVSFSLTGTTWGTPTAVLIASGVTIYTISGRNESIGGVPTWVLYASSNAALWRYVPSTATTTQLAVAPSGSYFRGVVPAPFNAAFTPAPPLPSFTSTASWTPSCG